MSDQITSSITEVTLLVNKMMVFSPKCANIAPSTLIKLFMSVVQTARFPDDVHAELKAFCDRINSNPNAEIVTAVRKHIGMPTFEERLEWAEEQIAEISDRLKTLEQASAIANQQSAQHDIQSNVDD
jgi:hypothetical protein